MGFKSICKLCRVLVKATVNELNLQCILLVIGVLRLTLCYFSKHVKNYQFSTEGHKNLSGPDETTIKGITKKE